jgi:hypothetical protein
MEELLEQYLRILDSTTIDCFRALFYEASDSQLDDISARYEIASEPYKELIHDDGVGASMIRWLGEELILISLYHLFERKLKEIIQYKHLISNGGNQVGNIELHRWDEMKKHIPESVKNSNEYQQVNILRVLVNCFKHAGIVSKELNKLEPSFGKIGDEICGDLEPLYERYKTCASSIIMQTYDDYETQQ